MRHKIKIQTKVAYLARQSNVVVGRYAYAYTITIINHGSIGVQLRSRHWLITDESGDVEEVTGEGVIGMQPHIAPGETFRYSSGAVIKTKMGTMKGSYTMLDDSGEEFEAEIPEFALREPYTLH